MQDSKELSSTTKDSAPSEHTPENTSPTPVALRTRSQSELSFSNAASNGICKLCLSKFDSSDLLKAHLLSHKPDKKQKKALQAIRETHTVPNQLSVTPHVALSHNIGKSRLFSPQKNSYTELSATLSLQETPDSTKSNLMLPGIQEMVEDLLTITCNNTHAPSVSLHEHSTPSPPSSRNMNKASLMASPECYRMKIYNNEVCTPASSSLASPQDSLLFSSELKMEQ
ncbi:hypothetical protein NPIL_505411 [Nephila pilipes]|uniref:C2H2-type domain-containing protein n=1 Tax=Nephila pilipes TaxID=299642 RepID=A0A8X6TFK6_NEPPI|nr:hypothetical protein NPIL_505411 [Nephila pilipes]